MSTQTQAQAPQVGVADLMTQPDKVEEQLTSMEELSNKRLQEYYERRDELNRQIAEATRAGEQDTIDTAKADLSNVEREIAKRAENIGIIMATIGQEMGMLEDLEERLLEDSPEDTAKREAAQSALDEATIAVAERKSATAAAEVALPELQSNLDKAERMWEIFDLRGKKGKIKTAKRNLSDAKSTIDDGPQEIVQLEKALSDARQGIVDVEEQIEVDKEHRLKELSLDRLYAVLTDAETRVSKIVRENIEALEKNIVTTKTELEGNRTLRIESAENRQELEESIAKKMETFGLKKAELADLVGQEDSPEYGMLENEVHALATEIDGLGAQKRIEEGKMSTAQVNISELETTMKALNSDRLLAQNNYNDFVLTIQKAKVNGDNIALLLRTQAAKVSANSLSKGRDAITLASLDTSLATDSANRKTMADDAARRLSLLDQMSARIDAGDAAAAEHDRRYADHNEEYKEKYGQLGAGRGGSDHSDSETTESADSGGEKPELF